MDKWANKVAVVTGASAGIGAAIAVELAKHKLTVFGLARRKEKVEALAAQHKNLPGKIHAVECDVTKSESITAAFDLIEKKFGGVDILVNNAGTIRNGLLTDLKKPDDDFLLQIDTNVKGLVLCTRRALKTMQQREAGYIININSVAGHATPNAMATNQFGMNLYGATKWAVTNVTEVLRLELAGAGNKVRVSSVSPAGTETDIFEVGGVPKDALKTLPLMKASDIADAVVYLLSTKPSIVVSELTIHPAGCMF